MRRRWIALLGAYLALLAVSHAVRSVTVREPAPRAGQAVVRVGSDRGDAVRLALFDMPPPASGGRGVPVLLLHGSPGSGAELRALGGRLARDRRVLVPDLPGFGASERDVPDYSARAAAALLDRWLRDEGLDAVHVVGFSWGGAVAIELADRRPRGVASLTLLSAIGVQELELFGAHRINRVLHGAQLAGLVAARALLPHMGALDNAYFGVEYARSFYDTDQRPLRAMLERWDGPALVVHGRHDPLVPPEAALEHHRVVPQSRLAMLPHGHFMAFAEPAAVLEPIARFLDDVERGDAPTRTEAPVSRVAAAARPFDPSGRPPARGLALVLLVALIVVATFVSEDLACIGVGLIVASGRIEFLPGTLACLAGITLGDLGLFVLGRLVGAAALDRAPLRWVMSRERVERSRQWFVRRGLPVILFTRFVPGTRLPTYFAAGLVGTPFPRFAVYFLLAAAAWTPLLVGASALVGVRMIALFAAFERTSLLALAITVALILAATRLVLPLASFRGRRRLVSAWRRWTRWEFWPPWLLYPPVIVRLIGPARRAGGITVFTAANPAIPGGGFIGESKFEILRGLGLDSPHVARSALVVPGPGRDPEQMLEDALARLEIEVPVVLKPDIGQRGQGVEVARTRAAAVASLARRTDATIVQEFVPGVEIGAFWVRRPERESGEIFSVTEKRMPTVVGDGSRTLEELILLDERAVALARTYCVLNADRLDAVPAAGESVALAELGTHCRGAIFLDGAHLATPALREALEQVSRGFPGFHFGRFDLRAPTFDDLRAGRRFKVIELNGVTSEASHVYDPRYTVREARATLVEQWTIAYEIGRANVERGHRPARLAELWRIWRRSTAH